jgi:hypothetical protein
MRYRVNPDGSIDAATATEAIELAEMVRARNAEKSTALFTALLPKSGGKVAPKPAISPEAAQEISGEFSDWVVPSAIKFLGTIQQASASGASAQEIMQAIGISDPKAFGGRSAAINKLITRTGFSVSQVYDASRNGQGRFWKGKSKLGEALNVIKTMATH